MTLLVTVFVIGFVICMIVLAAVMADTSERRKNKSAHHGESQVSRGSARIKQKD